MHLNRVRLIDIPTHSDERGVLSAVEELKDIPFDIKRIFYVHHIKSVRGCHALKDTDEVLIPIAGSFSVRVYDSENVRTYILDDLTKGLYIPRLIYLEMFDFSPGAVCLVLAGLHYDPDQYISSLEDYRSYMKHIKL